MLIEGIKWETFKPTCRHLNQCLACMVVTTQSDCPKCGVALYSQGQIDGDRDSNIKECKHRVNTLKGKQDIMRHFLEGRIKRYQGERPLLGTPPTPDPNYKHCPGCGKRWQE